MNNPQTLSTLRQVAMFLSATCIVLAFTGMFPKDMSMLFQQLFYIFAALSYIFTAPFYKTVWVRVLLVLFSTVLVLGAVIPELGYLKSIGFICGGALVLIGDRFYKPKE